MMMLKIGDSGPNRFSQDFGESAMGSLKQAILEQELTFRNQVRELHRLYWAQKTLMREIPHSGINAQVGNALLFRNHQRNFNLQLPADAFISIDTSNNNLETIASKANGKFDVEKSLLSFEIIDLEDSVDLDSHEKGKLSLKESNACCVPPIPIVHFGEFQDRRLKEQMPHVSCAGIYDSSLDTVNDHSKITHESKTVLFDLNIPVGDSEVHDSSQNSTLADDDAKKFNHIESKLDINAMSSAYTVEGSTGSSDGAALISINLLQTVTSDSTKQISNHEKSEEEAADEAEAQQNALLGGVYGGYSSNNMSDCNSYEKGTPEAATLSITDDSVITQSHSTENEEQDAATTEAAQTLMAISFTEVSCEEDESDELQVSSDSFEAMTMHLSEIRTDEIKPDVPRFNVREKDEMRVRPKRGKGLRNFQKEILPGLVSLSRHEICEDLYSINYEFRRSTFRTAGNFFAPVTSRRSRLYSGRRRRRSFAC